MSHTDPANYPECLRIHEPESEAKTRRLERIGDLHARAEAARKTRGAARIHYTLFMMSLRRDDLITLGIPPKAILKHCPQFRPDPAEFNFAATLKEQTKCNPNPTSQTSRKRRRF